MIGPVTTVKYNGRKVRLIGFGVRKYQLFRLGNVGVASIRERLSRGVGSNDQQMPPLAVRRRRRWSKKQEKWVEYGDANVGYARDKRRAGLSGIRDLYGMGVGWTGSGRKQRQRKGKSHMLDALRVVSASETQARIDISTADARIKARANEQRSPWFGFSGRDVRNLLVASREIFGEVVSELRTNFAGAGRAANAAVPVWMDPLGISSRAGMVRNFRPTLAGQMADRLSSRYGRNYNIRRAA